jgi:3-dehydroquinate dehydratase / shikimate dehydrogenase
MPDDLTLRTERLILRPWHSQDRAPFAALNADPRVMEWFPTALTTEESDAFADRIDERFHHQGWGLWAVEIPGAHPFIGFVGLNPADATLGYPGVEVGWRIAAEHWGHGYAPEGAVAALIFGFDRLKLDEIVSFTASGNVKSRRVMEKLGMVTRPEDDFAHPRVPADSPVSHHVLYRLSRSAFHGKGAFDTVTRST